MEVTVSLPYQVGNPKGTSLYSSFQHCTGLHHQLSLKEYLSFYRLMWFVLFLKVLPGDLEIGQ